MIKRKKHQLYYWLPKTDYAVERYIKWESKPHIQQRIYKEHIEIPLRNISRKTLRNVIYFKKGEKLIEYDPYKESTYQKEIENIVDECVSFFFTTLLPYIKNGTIKNTFGYIKSSIKHYLISLNIDRTFNYVGGSKFVPLPTSEDEKPLIYRQGFELPKIEGSDLSIDEVDLINQMMGYWDKNIEYIWSRKNQSTSRQVARAVIELMRRSHQIKYFRLVSMRRYLRKMLGWEGIERTNTSERNTFNKVILFMRDRNKLLRFQYNKTGMIDYYYI